MPEAINDNEHFKYWAFISYSHADTRWSEWVHKKLEAYRVPRALVGNPSRDGKVPRRLFPIFRDREELPVSSDLGANLRISLKNSRYLVVICSPSAAKSHWVNEEVRNYKSWYGENRLLCLIVSGEPNSGTDSECFPPAVRHGVRPDGELTPERSEPIAADIRPQGDGVRRAKIKLLAGLLGVNFDELWHRERRRRIRRIVQYSTTILAVAVIGTFAWRWASSEQRRHIWITHNIEQGKNELNAGRRIQAAAFFANARKAGDTDKELEGLLRDSAKGLIEPLVTLKGGHSMWVTFASFIDPDHVVTTSWDGTARLWDLKTATSTILAKEVSDEHQPVVISTAIFSRDGGRFVTTTWNGYARVYTRDGALKKELNHTRKRVNWAEFSPDGQRVVTACDDWLGRIWTLDSDAKPVELPHDNFVKTAVFDPTGARVLTASFDRSAKIWDTTSGERQIYLPNPAEVNSARFSPDGKTVATACLDGSVTLWDITKVDNTGQPKPTKRTWAAHPGKRANSVVFNGDGSRLLTTGDDRTAKVWDVKTGELLLSFELHGDVVVYGAFSVNGDRAVSASKDTTAIVFSANPPNSTLDQIVTEADKLAKEASASKVQQQVATKTP